MQYKDYYAVMGLERDASVDDVKRAYRKLARKYHPDVSKEPDAEERFKELGEAYEVLRDPEKRAAYDELGANWRAGQDFRPPPNWDAGFEFSGDGSGAADFSDFFEQLFSQGRRGHGVDADRRRGAHFYARGGDHHAKVFIRLEDAYQGATRSISLRSPSVDANGHVVMQERTLRVKIPKGVSAGQQIRLAGQGAPGLGGVAGDLYLEVNFEDHPLYRVDGKDVILSLPVAPWEAALGARVEVPTPDGTVSMKVPAGTAAGRKLRLKGRGIPAAPPGDLYAVIEIALPPADTDSAKRAYQSMREQFDFEPRSHLGG